MMDAVTDSIVEFRDVTKSFGSRMVLNNAHFKIKKGEIVFILGTSGTGKSVLLKTLVGLMKADSGEVYVEGRNISPFSEDELLQVRRDCGMVFQQPALFDSITIFENVAFGLRRNANIKEEEIGERVRKALALVHLNGIEDRYPGQISYGMQKRASLARTLVLQPKILLFDEPTTGLDPITTGAINRLVKELSDKLKTTSIVVSHDMRCALEIADRILILEKGQIGVQGTPSELQKSQHPLVNEFLMELREGGS